MSFPGQRRLLAGAGCGVLALCLGWVPALASPIDPRLGPDPDPAPPSGSVLAGNTPAATSGGQAAVAELQVDDPNSARAARCSATLISANTALTAAHCVGFLQPGAMEAGYARLVLAGKEPLIASNIRVSPIQDLALINFIPRPGLPTPARLTAQVPTVGTQVNICGIRNLTDAAAQGEGKIFCGQAQVDAYTVALTSRQEANGGGQTVPSVNVENPLVLSANWGVGLRLRPSVTRAGDSGGPVFDPAGRLVAVLSGGSDQVDTTPLVAADSAWLSAQGIDLPSLQYPASMQVTTYYDARGFFPVQRTYGKTRVQTALQLYRPSPVAILTTGLVAADGLCATALSGAAGWPSVLLSMSTGGGLESEVLSTLRGKAVKKIYVVGSRVRLSAADRRALSGKEIVYLGGATRFDTSIQVAKETIRIRGYDRPPGRTFALFAADGMDFPDALAAGRVAGQDGDPLVLTRGNYLPPVVADFVAEQRPHRPEYIAVGGPAHRALLARGLHHRPVFGMHRYETAALLAYMLPSSNTAKPRFTLVVGDDFPDAISGGVWAGKTDADLLLAPRNPGQFHDVFYLNWAPCTVQNTCAIHILGGPRVISPDFLGAFK